MIRIKKKECEQVCVDVYDGKIRISQGPSVLGDTKIDMVTITADQIEQVVDWLEEA